MPKLSEIHEYEPLQTISASKWKVLKDQFAKDGISPHPMELVDSSVLIGVEVEVENCVGLDYAHWQSLWRSEADNSLRDNGLELVSLPMKGEHIQYALALLPRMLNERVRFSPRTSIHVHMNVRDMTPEEVAKMTLVYLTVEKLLFRFAGEYREKNIFCVPLYALGMLDHLFHQLNSLDKRALQRIQSQELRYSAMNFEPLFGFGTVEFRHLGGTRNPDEIMSWINLLLRVRRYAMQKTLSDLIKEIIELNSNSHYRGYAQSVFGDQFWSLGSPDIDGDIEQGVLSVKKTILSGGFAKKLSDGTHETAPAAKVAKVASTVLSLKPVAPEPAIAAPLRRPAPVVAEAWGLRDAVFNPVTPQEPQRIPIVGMTNDNWQENERNNTVMGVVNNTVVTFQAGLQLPSGYWMASAADRRLFRNRAVEQLNRRAR